MTNYWRKLKDAIILFLADRETVYAGPGTYHWLNHEGRVLLRNTQRIVGFGAVREFNDWRTENAAICLGLINTMNLEKTKAWLDSLEAEKKRQANAYYDWLLPRKMGEI